MFFNNPEKFESFLKPVGGNTTIRPVKGNSFNAEICMKKLQYVGLFSISANSFKVIKDPQQDFFGLTIPLSSPLHRYRVWKGSALLFKISSYAITRSFL